MFVLTRKLISFPEGSLSSSVLNRLRLGGNARVADRYPALSCRTSEFLEVSYEPWTCDNDNDRIVTKVKQNTYLVGPQLHTRLNLA